MERASSQKNPLFFYPLDFPEPSPLFSQNFTPEAFHSGSLSTNFAEKIKCRSVNMTRPETGIT